MSGKSTFSCFWDYGEDQTKIHVHLEKRMFWKVIEVVQSSGLEEFTVFLFK